MAEAKTIGVIVTADVGQYISSMNRVKSMTGNAMSSAGGSMKKFSSMAAGSMAAAAAAVGTFGLAISKVGIEHNAMKEQALIAWETILGSANEAAATVQRLEKMGAVTPFEYQDLDKAAKMLNMAGFEGEKLYSTLTAVGDSVSAIGGGADELQGISTALFQMATKGKVSAEEMMQLAERGIPAWQILADSQGKSVQEMMKLSEEGKLFSDDVLPALIDGLGNRFGGAMEKQSKTFKGMIATLKDESKMLASDLTKGLFEGMKGFLPLVIDMVSGMRKAFEEGGLSGVTMSLLPPGLVQKAQELLNGVKPILEDAVTFFKGIGNQLVTFWQQNGQQIIQAIENVCTAISAIFKVVWPVILLVVKTTWDMIKNIIQGAVNVILGLVKIFTGLFTADWSILWEGIKQTLSGAVSVIWGLINLSLFGRVLKGMKAFGAIFKGIWNNVKTTATNLVKGMSRKISNIFSSILSTASNIFNRVKSAITKPIEAAKKSVLNIIDKIKGAFSKLKIKIPKPSIPKISVGWKTVGKGKASISIPVPKFGGWMATGGIATDATIVGVGERGDEAIVPLSQKHRMRPFAEAVAEMMPGGQEKGITINNYFNIDGVTIREEADIQHLAEELTRRQKIYARGEGVINFAT